MFKNAIIYRINEPRDFSTLPAFVPCGATQQQSVGFVPPRGFEHGALVENVGREHILKLQTEVKVLPSDAVKRRVEEVANGINDQTGRRPGKKQMAEIKESVVLELLPQCLTRRSAVTIWFSKDLLVIDTTSSSKADDIAGLLVRCVDGLSIAPVQTSVSPAKLMTDYLLDGAEGEFAVDRDVELHATDETRAVVKYNRHTLDLDQVRDHIIAGKVPTKLALTWAGRVSFNLTDTMQLRRLKFLDVVFESRKPDDDPFDANAAIATGEMSVLIADLLDELDDEDDLGI